MKKAAVLLGSDSDFPVVRKCTAVLKHMQIPFECHICSAHRTPDKVADFARGAESSGFGVIICAAGMAAHLAGAAAAQTTLPVIGIPIASGGLGGLDALLSTAQMPSGIPVAAVAVGGAENAGLLAAQILAVEDPALAERVRAHRTALRGCAAKKDEEFQITLRKELEA